MNKTTWILLAAITWIVMYFCSYYTHSDWRVLAFDQDIFYVIGRNWAEGNLPYITAWDSKGPIIFFFNMLGYLITKSEQGVFLLQYINMVITVCCCYFMSNKSCGKKEAWIYTCCFIASYMIINSGGNQVGDCTLPLSALTIFLTYRWSRNVQDGIISHPWKYAICYGLYFGACLLSRLTNAMVLCSSILVIVCVLSYHKQWNNLLKNALAFIIGSGIIILPFAIYFGYHHALYDMWYASVVYNFEYALHSHPNAITDTHFPLLYFTFYNISIIAIIIFSITALICKDRDKVAYIWLPIAIITIGWIFKSYANANYTISYISLLMIALVELSILYHKGKRRIQLYAIYTICTVSLVGMTNYIRIFYYTSATITGMQKDADHQLQMIRQIPKNDSFILYNGLPYIYATSNIRPYYPYWICQDWAIENGISLRQKVRECYKKGNVKWIIVFEYEHSNIKDILLERYHILKTDKSSKLTLFKLKE